MTTIRNSRKIGRNDSCPCGSGRKFKKCCSPQAPVVRSSGPLYIDSGEGAIRWVICDSKGTSFFSDKQDRLIVFSDRAIALATASLSEFADQAPGEVNVAGVGPEKYEHLKNKLPYIEVSDIETAVSLVRERIEVKRAELEPELEQPAQAQEEEENEDVAS